MVPDGCTHIPRQDYILPTLSGDANIRIIQFKLDFWKCLGDEFAEKSDVILNYNI